MDELGRGSEKLIDGNQQKYLPESGKYRLT
jgi:hypothetical protein